MKQFTQGSKEHKDTKSDPFSSRFLFSVGDRNRLHLRQQFGLLALKLFFGHNSLLA
jgi:hypothetical protein